LRLKCDILGYKILSFECVNLCTATARSAELSRRLWDISESFVQETFEGLDRGLYDGAIWTTGGYAVDERVATGSMGGGGEGDILKNSSVDESGEWSQVDLVDLQRQGSPAEDGQLTGAGSGRGGER
jgi:hypothetical protein